MKIVVAVLMAFFASFEIFPALERLEFSRKYLILGGALSGFFGGLSGHQGALRSAFLVKSGLSKESFIGTGVVVACLVDLTRLSVYATHFATAGVRANLPLIGAATLSAFAGAFVGAKLMKKVTMRMIQIIVAAMLFGLSLALGTGII